MSSSLFRILIDWCLTPTLAVFHLYHGMIKFYELISSTIMQNKSESFFFKGLNQPLLTFCVRYCLMKITYNNRHNVYNGWFYPLGQDEDNIQ
jgi:hypothetical protein